MNGRGSTKSMKILPLENYPLYSIQARVDLSYSSTLDPIKSMIRRDQDLYMYTAAVHMQL